MSLFINTATGEYPRYAGDVELDPSAPWAEVVQTPRPEIGQFDVLFELEPELIDGVYHRRWQVTTLTEEEWTARRKAILESRLRSARISLDDVRTLLA